jgi:hypothetical protein
VGWDNPDPVGFYGTAGLVRLASRDELVNYSYQFVVGLDFLDVQELFRVRLGHLAILLTPIQLPHDVVELLGSNNVLEAET